MSTAPNVEWRDIPGHPGYQAGSDGSIRSLDRRIAFYGRWGSVERFQRGRVLRLKRRPNGYLQFYADGGCYPSVSRSVCAAFHGLPPSESHEAAHLDGDISNNRPENLVWATPVENAAHKIAHGTVCFGSLNGTSKLTEALVEQIIMRYAHGDKAAALADEFRVSPSVIRAVIRGKIWSHVESKFRDQARAMSAENIRAGRIAAARLVKERRSAARV